MTDLSDRADLLELRERHDWLVSRTVWLRQAVLEAQAIIEEQVREIAVLKSIISNQEAIDGSDISL